MDETTATHPTSDTPAQEAAGKSSSGRWKSSQERSITIDLSFKYGKDAQVDILRGKLGWMDADTVVQEDSDGSLTAVIGKLERNHAYLVRVTPVQGRPVHLLCCTAPSRPRVLPDSRNAEYVVLEWDPIDESMLTSCTGTQCSVNTSYRVSMIQRFADLEWEGKEVFVDGPEKGNMVRVRLPMKDKKDYVGLDLLEFKVGVRVTKRGKALVRRVKSEEDHVTFSTPLTYVTAPVVPEPLGGTGSSLTFSWGKNLMKQATALGSKERTLLDGHAIYVDITHDGSPSSSRKEPRGPVSSFDVKDLIESRKVEWNDILLEKDLVFENLNSKTWYWFRVRCISEKNGKVAQSPPIAVETAPSKPGPPKNVCASYTLYDDSSDSVIQARHLFVKLEWGKPAYNGSKVTEYIIKRYGGLKHEKSWKVVHRTSSDAAVLSAVVTSKAFHYQCKFRVYARNSMGLGPCTEIAVDFNVSGSEDKSPPNSPGGKTKKRKPKKQSQNDKLLQKTKQLVRDYLDVNVVVKSGKKSPNSAVGRGKSPPQFDIKIESITKRQGPGTTSKKTNKDDQVKLWDQKDLTLLADFQKFKSDSLRIDIPPLKDQGTYRLPESSRSLLSEAAKSLSPTPPSDKKLDPYRQPLFDRSGSSSTRRMNVDGTEIKSPKERQLVEPKSPVPPSNKHVQKLLKDLGLPEMARLHSVHSEMEIRKELQKNELMWTYACRNSANKVEEDKDKASGSAAAAADNDNDKEEDDDFITNVRVCRKVPKNHDKKKPNKDGTKTELDISKKPTNLNLNDIKNNNLQQQEEEFKEELDDDDLEDEEDDFFLAEREDKAAIMIQSAARMHQAQAKYRPERDVHRSVEAKRVAASIKVNSFFRMISCRRTFYVQMDQFQREREDATLRIQSAMRGRKAKKEFEQRKQETVHAIKIQSQVRKQLARQELKRMKSEKMKVEIAATKIQASFRALEARREVHKLEETRRQRTLQALLNKEKVEAEEAKKELEQAAIRIQARFRGHRDQLAFRKKVDQIVLKAAVRLQTRWRGHNARSSMKIRKRVQIKSVVRISVTRCGMSKCNGIYETMGITDSAASYVMSSATTDETFVVERGIMKAVPVWTLKAVKPNGETVILYANTSEGASVRPPRTDWAITNGVSPAPIIVWKSSENYLTQMSMMNREAIVVADSGCGEIHGRYVQSGVSDGVPQYVFNKRGSTFIIMRTPYQDTKIWLLVGSLQLGFDLNEEDEDKMEEEEEEEEKEGDDAKNTSAKLQRNNSDGPPTPLSPQERSQSPTLGRRPTSSARASKRIYYVNTVYGSSEKPPTDGWAIAQHGKEPEPVFVKQNKLNAATMQ